MGLSGIQKENLPIIPCRRWSAPAWCAIALQRGAAGVSTGETATLNLGFRRRDTYENVRRNYEICVQRYWG